MIFQNLKSVFAVALAATLLTGCMHNVNTPVPPPPGGDPLITSLTIAVGALPALAGAHVAIVNSLYADKKITKKERDTLKEWTQDFGEASVAALKVLRSDHPRELKVISVSTLINDALMSSAIKTMTPEVKAAYIGLSVALQAIETQLKANLEIAQ